MTIYLFIYLFIYLYRPLRVACRILVPRPGIKPLPPLLEDQSLNHWTAREVPFCLFFSPDPGKKITPHAHIIKYYQIHCSF